MNRHSQVIEQIRNVAHQSMPQGGRVFLYGSRARGEAHSDSDWDLLLILDKENLDQSDYDNVVYPFTSLGWDLGEMIIPVIYTAKEWAANSFTSFFKNVEQESIAIL
ncbi:MAG: nucleotidyltransferase domain-containing protein [Bacteroides sp.]|nr:nucleotidyltransferase domain-containing protein [Bacteroides sp.]